MYVFKFIYFLIVQLAKQASLLPQTIAAGFRRWSRQAEVREAELERLDRIRHPSKYLGK